MVLVSVFDSKADSYSAPHPSQSKASAIREFEMLVNGDHNNLIAAHPEDFTLFEVGEWLERVPVDNSGEHFTAKLVACPSFVALAKGSDLLKKE